MTSTVDRSTILELVTKYELEPTLRDVFVEGPSDKALIDVAMTTLDHARVVRTYEIDSIDVPGALVRAKNLKVGNKGRLVTLADEMERLSSQDLFRSVVCLVDLDLDGLL